MKLSHSQAVARLKEIEGEMSDLADKPKLSRSQNLRSAALSVEADEVNEHIKSLERYHDLARGNGGGRIRYDGEDDATNPYRDVDDDHDPTRGHRDRAMRTVDGLVSADRLPARAAEIVEGLTRSGSRAEQSWTARVAAATGSDDYLSAFSKLVSDPSRGHLLWDSKEQEAFRVVEGLRSETRAMSDIGTEGGYLVPLTLDPSVLISSAGSINPLRQIARVVTTATDSYKFVSSAGVTAEWLAEGSEAADASPTLAQPSIPVYKADAFVPFSFEVAQDALNFTQELGKLLADAYNQLTATAFTVGSGIGQPTGLVTALAAASGSVVNSAGTDVLASGDVYAVQNALPARFQGAAQWAANLSILNTLRQFETTNGALKFPSLQNDPPTLLGRPVHEISNADGTITASAENYVAVYGDFNQFVIVDRYPSQVEIIQNLFGSNRRPTGQRGAFLWARTGSDVIVPNALRVLNVT